MVWTMFSDSNEFVEEAIEEMDAEASALVANAGVNIRDVEHKLSVMMRYAGQGYEIETSVSREIIEKADGEGLHTAFTEAYRRRYGRTEEIPVEILSWRLAVEGPRSTLGETLIGRDIGVDPSDGVVTHRPAWFGEKFLETPVFKRSSLRPGTQIPGPAIIEETESTTIVPLEFTLGVDQALNLVLTRVRS